MVQFSRRLNWEAVTNRLTQTRIRIEKRGETILDLTETNPTRIGLTYPIEELQEILARAASGPYEPEPLGIRSAREAVAKWLSRDRQTVSAEDIVLTASTSEAYSWLFKLLTNQGDHVIGTIPSYPLLDHLTALDGVGLQQFPMLEEKRWTLDIGEFAQLIDPERVRAVVVVHPNNPTGSFLTMTEQNEVAALCRRLDMALISDEVFADYRWDTGVDAAPPAAARDDVLSFSLGGLSKSAGLPHWKLGWIRVGGPAAERQSALAALELIADSYLSVATPVQRSLPELWPAAQLIQDQIRNRVRKNLDMLKAVSLPLGSHLLPVEGGWSAVLRVPAVISDEELAIELLEREGVLMQPGYFFDFPREGYLVLSLLPRIETFTRGVTALVRYLNGRVG